MHNIGMSRKLKLFQPKYSQAKSSLPLSLPLSAYLTAPVSDLNLLYHRISTQKLPDGWITHSFKQSDDGSLFLSSVPAIDSSTLIATTTFVVKVDRDLKWSLSYHGILVQNNQCDVLSVIPPKVSCVQDILTLLNTIQNSRMCSGNSVEDFEQIVEQHGGAFKDTKGQPALPCVAINSSVIFFL